jgi:putative restriction endonuclease
MGFRSVKVEANRRGVYIDLLCEVDGPMLKYGLQEVQGNKIIVPHTDRLRPRREFLEERFEVFKRAA